MYELAFALTVLVVAALVQRTGWEPPIVRISALLLVLLCPWLFNARPDLPQFRLVLAPLLLAGVDSMAAAGEMLPSLGGHVWHWISLGDHPVHAGVPAVALAGPTVLVMLAIGPATLPDYQAYFYENYRGAYVFFADMPGQTIYAYGLRPYFLLGRRTQHRVIYDLNPPEALVSDASAFVQSVTECVSPDFLVFSDHLIGNGYFPKLRHRGLEVVVEDRRFLIFRNPSGGRSGRRVGCPARYVMNA